MNRDEGLRRTTIVTVGLAGISLAGVVAVATAAHTSTGTANSDTSTTAGSTDTSGTSGTSDTTDTGSGTSTFPNLGSDSGSGGHATSGGS